jgi:hypothetical protein
MKDHNTIFVIAIDRKLLSLYVRTDLIIKLDGSVSQKHCRGPRVATIPVYLKKIHTTMIY